MTCPPEGYRDQTPKDTCVNCKHVLSWRTLHDQNHSLTCVLDGAVPPKRQAVREHTCTEDYGMDFEAFCDPDDGYRDVLEAWIDQRRVDRLGICPRWTSRLDRRHSRGKDC